MNRIQLSTMIALQNTMNQKVHPRWDSQGFKWTRAIMVEGVEAMEHHGWKWWKKQTPDMPQMQIELVDIWHFILSYYIERHGDAAIDRLDTDMNSAPDYFNERPVLSNLETLISRAGMGEVHIPTFKALLHQTGLTYDELYRMYVAKNVLNMFRQNNGYKEGTYIKDWFGQEDNVVLEKSLAQNPTATPEQIMAALTSYYATVLLAQAPADGVPA
jgi:dimeric dUTPase (all-alpha-NTP-PPase superfamily)